MSNIDWLKNLVRAEQQMEASDMVDFSIGFDANQTLHDETVYFLKNLKESFVEYSLTFNQLKGGSTGNIKIYGIANTEADFMLFRNGFKLIFTMKEPGQIGIRFQTQASFLPTPGSPGAEGAALAQGPEELLEAQWGAFGELQWTHQSLKVNPEFLVRYYLTTFVRESAK